MTAPARALADEFWEFRLDNRHFSNLGRGELSRLERWDDLSAEGSEAIREACLRFAERAGDSAALAGADRTLAETVEAAAFMDASVGVWRAQLGVAGRQAGLLSALVPALHLQPLVTADHGRRYLEKLRRFPALIDQLVERLEEGAAIGRAPLARHVRQSIGQLDRFLARPPEDDPIATQAAPIELDPVAASRWCDDLVDAIRDHVRPGLARFARTLNDVSLPAGRSSEQAGLCHLPGGDSVYAAMVKGHTTLDLGPEEIHELGLARVGLLEEEYLRVAAPLLGTRQLPEIYRRLREDPGLQYSRPGRPGGRRPPVPGQSHCRDGRVVRPRAASAL